MKRITQQGRTKIGWSIQFAFRGKLGGKHQNKNASIVHPPNLIEFLIKWNPSILLLGMPIK